MTYRGHVCNGVVVLDDAVTLPEGLGVKVEPMEPPESPSEPDDDGPTLYECLEPFIGKLEGLPPMPRLTSIITCTDCQSANETGLRGLILLRRIVQPHRPVS